MLTKITALFLTTVTAEQIFSKHPEVETAEFFDPAIKMINRLDELFLKFYAEV